MSLQGTNACFAEPPIITGDSKISSVFLSFTWPNQSVLSQGNHISALPRDLGARYELLRPIPVEINKVGHQSYVALFRAANISMTGVDESNAKNELAGTIVDFMETFQDDPDFSEEVATAKLYIRERHAEET